VIPPAATLIYRGMKKPPAEIGKELNADVLLVGTVSRAGNRLEIMTRLVNASSGRDLWTHTYDSAAADLPASQNQIERDIAAQVHASAPDRARMIDTRKLDPRAYDLYLRGSYHIGRYNPQDDDQAIGLFEQAIAISPDFAPLQANLASAYAEKSFFFAPDDPECEGRAFAAIAKAFALDPNSAEAHLARGELLWRPSHGFPHRAALAEFRLAAAARPNLGEAWAQIASVLLHVGHLDEALVEVRKAEALNPGQTSASGRVQEIYLFQGKPQLSLDEESRTPGTVRLPISELDHTWALIDLGRFEQAARSIRTGFEESKAGAAELKHAVSALLAARQGNRQAAESEIRAALAEPQGLGQFHHATFMIACTYSVLGDMARAQEWMERTVENGFQCFTLFEVEPSLELWRKTSKGHEFLVNLRREWEATP
jgi:tetratricopeptide (TPR) repeat protein